MPLDELADFTTKATRPVVCQRCHASFENGTELFFMHDRKGDGPGKHICAGCRQYYLRKTESIRRTIGHGHQQTTPEHQITPERRVDISTQKAVAAAQRQGFSHPLRVSHSAATAELTRQSLPWPKRTDVAQSGKPMNQNLPHLHTYTSTFTVEFHLHFPSFVGVAANATRYRQPEREDSDSSPSLNTSRKGPTKDESINVRSLLHHSPIPAIVVLMTAYVVGRRGFSHHTYTYHDLQQHIQCFIRQHQ